MRLFAWIVVGFLATVIMSALAARLPWAHVMPNMALIVVVFLAMRKEAPEICFVAVALGHVVGLQALAPTGLHETALALIALGAFLISGNLSATGSLYVGCVACISDVAYHIALVLLLVWQGYEVGFSSWATAALLPQAVFTGLCGWALYRPLEYLDETLTPRRTEGLQWR